MQVLSPRSLMVWGAGGKASYILVNTLAAPTALLKLYPCQSAMVGTLGHLEDFPPLFPGVNHFHASVR